MKCCIKCKIELTDLNWLSSRKKKNHTICRTCCKKYLAQYYGKNFKVIRERSSNRFKRIGADRNSASLATIRHRDKKKGREICDLNKEEFKNIISKPCTYCGDIRKIGLDRIDNSKGHIKTNVVPCCYECNTAKSDNFTLEEMLIVGAAIRAIKIARGEYRV